jgi:hypothetical protein
MPAEIPRKYIRLLHHDLLLTKVQGLFRGRFWSNASAARFCKLFASFLIRHSKS